MGLLIKLNLKNSQDIRMLMAATFVCFRLTVTSEQYKNVKAARVQHANRTRGKSGHDEGGPDGPAFCALVLSLITGAGQEHKQVMEQFLKDHPPPGDAAASIALQRAVPICTLQKMHSSDSFKLFFRLPLHKPLQDAVEACLVKLQFRQYHGQAPRGAMERRVQDLMKELGFDEEEGDK